MAQGSLNRTSLIEHHQITTTARANMKTHMVAEWIPNAPREIRNVLDSVLQPGFSTIQMADRIRTLATHGHFLACPWDVRVHLMNPEQVDWVQVRRIVKAD